MAEDGGGVPLPLTAPPGSNGSPTTERHLPETKTPPKQGFDDWFRSGAYMPTIESIQDNFMQSQH
jgi:hypothetical protein